MHLKYPSTDEVNKLVLDRILVSSAVTKSSDEYIKEAVSGFLIQYYAIKTGLILVNEDPKALEQSMMLASLKPEDFILLLNGSLKSMKGKVGTAVVVDSQTFKSAEEKAEAALADQLSEVSCEAIIENTKEALGANRVIFGSSDFALQLHLAGYKVGTIATFTKASAKTKYLYVKKPAELDYTQLNLDETTTFNSWMLFDCIMKYETGIFDTLAIPQKALPKNFLALLSKISKWTVNAVELSHNAAHNNIAFGVIDDPFASLFNNL